MRSKIQMILAAGLLLGLVTSSTGYAAGKTATRELVITELAGTVHIKSAGGALLRNAFVGMKLRQGDSVQVDEKSFAQLTASDSHDVVSLGSDTSVVLSVLKNQGNGKLTKLQIVAGSVWSNVNKLSKNDSFKLVTANADLTVRGTKVLTNVDSETGETYTAVAAGIVSATPNSNNNSNENNPILIAPSQQLSLDSRDQVSDLETKVSIIDPNALVSGTSSEIIEAIVKDKASIDQENAEFIASQKDKIAKGADTALSRDGATSSLSTSDQDTLDKVSKNLDNLIGNVVKTAVDTNKVDKGKIEKTIEEVNQTSSKPLDLNKVTPLDKTAGVDPDLQKAKDAELKKLEDAKKAADAAKKTAESAAKQKLADALKKLEDEKARIAKEKEALGLNKPSTTTPTNTSTSNNSTPPAPANATEITGFTVANGTVVGATRISYAAGTNNSLRIVKQATAFTTPNVTFDARDTGVAYVSGNNIANVSAGDHIGLYEIVSSTGLVVKFVDITVSGNNIAVAPGALTPTTDYSLPEQGSGSGKAKFATLGQLPTGATKWQIIASVAPIATPIAGSSFGGTDYSAGVDIDMSGGKQFIALAATDASGNVVRFKLVEYTAPTETPSELVSLYFPKHYSGPVGGSQSDTAKLYVSLANLPTGATKYQILTSTSSIATPAVGATFGGTDYSSEQDIDISNGKQHIGLAATDASGKVVGFVLTYYTLPVAQDAFSLSNIGVGSQNQLTISFTSPLAESITSNTTLSKFLSSIVVTPAMGAPTSITLSSSSIGWDTLMGSPKLIITIPGTTLNPGDVVRVTFNSGVLGGITQTVCETTVGSGSGSGVPGGPGGSFPDPGLGGGVPHP
ncbi:FecR domain-containing protein [Cohnella silvisoli]|uniref:FecR domain-containing protein n=1 Tax=Cohnella silvisoli TaxID=2873699 RepID=A0ABV1KSU5_9BACL|nr:FecR domain-containing protein [Cohnella silvisoli]